MNFTITDLPKGQKIKNIKIDISFIDGDGEEITNSSEFKGFNSVQLKDYSSNTVDTLTEKEDMKNIRPDMPDMPDRPKMPEINDITGRIMKGIPKEMENEEF